MDKSIISILKSGGIGVLSTDTIYGLVGLALSADAVERIYGVRKRHADKPFIILIGSIDDIALFGIDATEELRQELARHWPGPVSIILPLAKEVVDFEYLHRGTGALAFRLPDKEDLVDLLKQTGPLVAPSANLEGQPPACTIAEAREYFGDQADFYADAGMLEGKPSRLLKLTPDGTQTLRG